MITFSDDGRGIAWHAVREKASRPGFADDDLVEALFADGMSTATRVTEISGRGVGMSAVRSAADKLGAQIKVASLEGRGTTASFDFSAAWSP